MLPPPVFVVLTPGPFPLDGCPDVVIPGNGCPADDPSIPPRDVCMPVDMPPPPGIVGDAPFDAGVLVPAIRDLVEVGGAVYTVLTSGGRVAPASAVPATVVVPVTCVRI